MRFCRDGTTGVLCPTLAALLIPLSAGALSGQGDGRIGEAVRELDRGTLTFVMATEDELEVCEYGVRIGTDSYRGRWSGRDQHCTRGAGRIVLEVWDGEVREIGLEPADSGPGDVDLGEVLPDEGADFLLGLAETAGEEVAEDAIFPATVVKGVESWPRLIDVARDPDRPTGVREDAIFWLGQEAGERVVGELGRFALYEEELEVRKAAVFALSQMDHGEGVDALLELAREELDGELKKTVFFWLAESEDPRVLDLFSEILAGRD